MQLTAASQWGIEQHVKTVPSASDTSIRIRSRPRAESVISPSNLGCAAAAMQRYAVHSRQDNMEYSCGQGRAAGRVLTGCSGPD